MGCCFVGCLTDFCEEDCLRFSGGQCEDGGRERIRERGCGLLFVGCLTDF